MPTYDYQCDACEHQYEVFQPIKSEVQQTCPRCKKRRARRLIGAGAGILFRGSGFYETDYRSAHYQERAKSEGSAGAAADKDAAAKSPAPSASESPAKPAAKTESTPPAPPAVSTPAADKSARFSASKRTRKARP